MASFGGIPTPSTIASGVTSGIFGAIRTYDPALVQVIVGVIPLYGFEPETMISVRKSKPTFTGKVGIWGEFMKKQTEDYSGEMFFSLMQTSESNALLTTAYEADHYTGWANFPVLVIDLSGGTVILSTTAFIEGPPEDTTFKKTDDVRRWKLRLATCDIWNTGNFLL